MSSNWLSKYGFQKLWLEGKSECGFVSSSKELLMRLKRSEPIDIVFLIRVSESLTYFSGIMIKFYLNISSIESDPFGFQIKLADPLICRLYEQQKKKKATSSEIALVLGDYVKRWQCWCSSGLKRFNTYCSTVQFCYIAYKT